MHPQAQRYHPIFGLNHFNYTPESTHPSSPHSLAHSLTSPSFTPFAVAPSFFTLPLLLALTCSLTLAQCSGLPAILLLRLLAVVTPTLLASSSANSDVEPLFRLRSVTPSGDGGTVSEASDSGAGGGGCESVESIAM